MIMYVFMNLSKGSMYFSTSLYLFLFSFFKSFSELVVNHRIFCFFKLFVYNFLLIEIKYLALLLLLILFIFGYI